MNMKETGEMIANARKEKGLTQQQLAKQLNITNKAVSKWERGINYPDIALLQPLCDILGLTITGLLCGEEPQAQQAVEKITEISIEEKSRLIREFTWRNVLTLVIMVAIMATMACLLYYGRPPQIWQRAIIGGAIGYSGVVAGNSIFMLRHFRKIK